MAPNSVTQGPATVSQSPADSRSKQAFEVDLTKPMVFQVGHLLERYDDWVHQPIVSKTGPRLFASDILETFTVTHWWVVPLIWIPVALWAEWNGIRQGVPVSVVPVCIAVGLLMWTMLEYHLHRFLFHWRTTTYWTNTLHYLLHGCHHKHPQDRYRLVMPPVLFFLLSTPILLVFRFVFPDYLVWTVYGGAIIGYVMYDMTHYWVHFGKLSQVEVAYKLRRHHMAHHFRNWNAGFGITSTLWDVLMDSTFENCDTPATEETVKSE